MRGQSPKWTVPLRSPKGQSPSRTVPLCRSRGQSPAGTVPGTVPSLKSQRGYLLITVVVALFLLATVAVLLSHDSAISANTSSSELEAARVEYVAQAGMQHALWRAQNNVCMGDVTIPAATLGSDTYDASITGADAGTAYVLSADQDAWIRSDNVTNNNGTDADQHIRFESGNTEHALTRFDLSGLPTDAKINTAVAWFHVSTGGASGGVHPEGPISIHRVTANWTEIGATWETMGGNFESSTLATIPAQAQSGVWVSFNLTAQVQAWVNGQPNHGILMRSVAEGVHGKYSSREDGGNAPRLEVVVSSGQASPVTIRATGELDNGVKRKLEDKIAVAYQPPGTVTLQLGTDPGEDAMLDSFYGARNYGGADYMQVHDNTTDWKQYPLIRFDLSGLPPDVAVRSARLELSLRSLNTPGTATVHRVSRGWVEGTLSGGGQADGATWFTHDGTNIWTSAGGDFDASVVAETAINGGETWVSWEIGQLVERWLAGEPNYGLMIRPDSALKQARFDSRDDADATLHPKLTIEYACKCGSACMAPGGSGKVLMLIGDNNLLTPGDLAKIALMESWGYTVDIQDDNTSAGGIASQMDSHDVLFVAESVDPTTVGTKLSAVAFGVVSEEGGLNDELGFASGSAAPVGSTINVSDNSHYITLPFAAGALDIYSADMAGLSVSGTPAPDLQSLADWGTDTGLAALDSGALTAGGSTSAGRRVMLPFGGDTLMDWSRVNNAGHLILQRSLVWAMGADDASSGKLLLVVGNAGSPSSKDQGRKTLMESWGYTVTLIDDGDSQANFNTAMAANDVVYVTDGVSGPTLVDKVTNTTTPVVNEKGSKLGNFGFSSIESGTLTAAAFTGTDALHYIAEPFGGNPVTVFDSSLSMAVPTGTLAPDLQNVGEIDSFGTGVLPVLATLKAGATLWDGGSAPARRVHLPLGAAEVSQLTADGKTIMRRAIEWGAGTGAAALPGYNVLLIVGNDTTLASKDVGYKALMESWGHTVAVLDDGASQADYDTAMAAADVIYASGSAVGSSMLDKATNTTKGLVNEVNGKIDNFGFSSSTSATTNFDAFSTTNAAHYITEPFTGSAVTVFTSSLTNPIPGGTLAPDLQNVGEVSGTLALGTLDTGATRYDGNPSQGRRAHLPFTSAETTDLTADGKTLMQRAIDWAAGAGPSCDADYVPDLKLSEFSTEAYGSRNIQSLTHLPEGKVFNGVAAPSGGAWISVNYSDGKIYMTDMSGTYLTEVTPPIGAPTGVTYVTSGTWADHLAVTAQTTAEIQYFDLTGNLVSSFSTVSIGLAGATDIAFIDSSSSGVYDGHLAVVDANADLVVMATQDGNPVHNFDTSAFSTTTHGMDHLPGTDKLLLIDRNATAFIVDFDGTVLRQYDTAPFGTNAPEAIAINPLTCDHVVGDDSPDLVVTLGKSGGGGGPPSGGIVFEEFTEGRNQVGVSSGMAIPAPSGTVAGDLLIAAAATDGNTVSTLSPYASWNLSQLDVFDSSGEVTFGVWWKIADGTEGSQLNYSWTGGEQAYGWIMRFTGHDPSSPIATASMNSGNNRNPQSNNLITGSNGNLILRLGGFDDDDITLGAPGLSGHTVITMDRSNTGVQNTVSGGAGYVIQTTAGDTGTSNFNLTAREQYRTVTIAIRPAP